MDTKKITFTKSEILYLLSTVEAEINSMIAIMETIGYDDYRKERLASLNISYKKLYDAYFN